MISRTKNGQSLHDQAVGDIARVRFTGENWEAYDAYTNPGGEKNKGIEVDGQTVFPDVVMTKKGMSTPTHVIEVETEESVTEEEAARQWAVYARAGVPFFLYVPRGSGATAKRMAAKLKIVVNYFREWWYEDGALNAANV